MKNKKYYSMMNTIFKKINDEIYLAMPKKEELIYKKSIVKEIRRDLQYWIKIFPTMHLRPE